MPRSRSALVVVIISDNPETLDGLERYLREAGISTRTTRSIARAHELATSARSAFVLFPDDFPLADVRAALAVLRRDRASTLRVLVTKNPLLFANPEGALVIPKPAWGWTILDAIRTRFEPTE